MSFHHSSIVVAHTLSQLVALVTSVWNTWCWWVGGDCLVEGPRRWNGTKRENGEEGMESPGTHREHIGEKQDLISSYEVNKVYNMNNCKAYV